MSRRPILPILLALGALLADPAPAPAKSSAYGEYVKAARLLSDWRYDEARARIAELRQKWPDAPETGYLAAELAFLDGDYQGSLDALAKLADDAVQGHVGQLRALATSTLAVTGGFDQIESSGGHFIIRFAPGKDALIADLAGDVLEQAYDALGNDLDLRPTEKVRVEILTRPKDLAQVSTLTEDEIETSGTIALCKYNKLMVVTPRATLFGYPWMDTLNHEYTHYVISMASHDSVPVWLHEGLARFEQSRWRSPDPARLTGNDEYLLANAVKQKSLISFRKMHPSMAMLPSQEAVALAFAEVYTMVGYLHDKVGYEGLRRILAKIRDGRSAQRAVAEVLDQRWKKVEKSWRVSLRSRKLRAPGGIHAARIRFRKGGEDSENVGVDEITNKLVHKHTRLGGLLRSRQLPEAAAVEYEKALAAAGDHEVLDLLVSRKLSRTYLELGKYDRAADLARRVLASDENDASAATTLGLAELAQGEIGAAEEAFTTALRVSPFDPQVRCSLADIYTARKRPSEAARERKACEELRQ